MPDGISCRPDFIQDVPANRAADGMMLRLNALSLSDDDVLNALHGCDKDDWYEAMMLFLKTGEPPKNACLEKEVRRMARDFRIRQRDRVDCLYRYYPEGDVYAPYIERPFRTDLIRCLHDDYGQFGRPGLLGLFHTHGYWPSMKEDAEKAPRFCPACQVTKGPHRSLEREHAQSLQDKKLRPFERWAIDL
ncbi:hypothetical protein KEM56_005480, partial [Ascosphaera pollenicola]